MQLLQRNPIARNTTWALAGQGCQILIQGIYFLFLGRSLGPEQFGAFAGGLAIVAILAPFAGWGSGSLLIRDVARDVSLLPLAWGNALLTVFVGGPIFTLVALAIGHFIPSLPSAMLVALALAELFAGKIFEIAGQTFQAVERLALQARLQITYGAAKLVAIVGFMAITERPTAVEWSYWYLGASVLTLLLSVILVSRHFGRPRFAPHRIIDNLGSGWHFSLGLASSTIYNDIDKTMLARMSTLEATGLYAAAYRIIAFAFVPVRSLLFATDARFYRDGHKGIRSSVAFARRLLPFSACYGLVATVGIIIFAPIVPLLLGREYQGSTLAIQLLGPIILLRSVHYLLANSLTGAGYQHTRSYVQVAVAVLNIVLNLWLIPLYSWQGAVWSSLISDFTLVIGLWLIVSLLQGRSGLLPVTPQVTK